VGPRPGLLERLCGIRERRWWAEGVSFVDGAAMAGAKAISESGVDPASIGLMINTSVSRKYLEPSTAVAVHSALGLPRSAQNFDVTNACLGFVNGMEIAAAMIDSGMIDNALIVNGEDPQIAQERTIDRLNGPGTTSKDVLAEFATLTLGAGAAAMVLGRTDAHPEGHRMVGSVTRAATEHHELCVGDFTMMRTDLKGLLDAGMELSSDMWAEAVGEFDWSQGMDRYVIHQVSKVHTAAMCQKFGIDPERVPLTFPTRVNLGPASVPFTLAGQQDTLVDGDRVLLMGVGSGLNVSCLEIAW
jgi:3-oxoacyl-[acyl-carrier-protein] synthase III